MNPKRAWPILLALLLLAGGCKKNAAQKAARTPTAPTESKGPDAFVFKVRTVPVRQGRLEAQREASGRIEPERNVRVASTLGEKVVAASVRVGERVARGQLLVQLDERAYRDQVRAAELALEQARVALSSAEKRVADQGDQLTAQLQAARQNMNNARKRLEEARSLLNLGGVAPVEVDALQAAYEQAKANAAAAEAAYRRWQRSKNEDLAQLRVQLQQARVGLDQARRALGNTRVLAPFAGQVAERYVDAGAFVGPGTPVVQLVAGPRNVIFRLPPDEVARLQPEGLEMLYLGRTYPLKIERTGPVPGQDRLVRVVARLVDEKEKADLPFGGAVQVRYRLLLAEGPHVPAGAVRVREGQGYVFVPRDGRAHALAVEIVAETEGEAVLKADPVPQRVVFPLPQDLRDGVRVEVLE